MRHLFLLAAALAFLLPVRAETFDSAGVKIHYTVEGQGEPVLLIHGFRASGTLNWRLPGVIRKLSGEFKVIALDNRGHGASDKPTGRENYGPKMAEDAVRLLDHLKLERVHVVGYSMGGMITMRLLATQPRRLRSAIVAGMGWMKAAEGLPPLLDRTHGPGTPGTHHADCARSFADLGLTEAEVKAVKTPVLVLVGERDPVLRTLVEPLRAVRKDWPVTVLPGANHMTAIFQPQFAEEIRSFLKRHSVKAPGDAGGAGGQPPR